jgi:hypothetical protein
MFEGLQHLFTIRRALRHRESRKRDFTRDIKRAQKEKNNDAVESLRAYQDFELNFADEEIDLDNSDYLVARAHRYLVPLPQEDECWSKSQAFGRGYLNRKGAAQVRADIRAEQKAMWDWWQARVTLVLSIFGSVIGLLAYFKK